jgi:hypothetical protein
MSHEPALTKERGRGGLTRRRDGQLRVPPAPAAAPALWSVISDVQVLLQVTEGVRKGRKRYTEQGVASFVVGKWPVYACQLPPSVLESPSAGTKY